MLLDTLGRLRLRGSNFQRTKPLLLLTYLNLRGPTARSDLARRFWPDAVDPRNSLRVCLLTLRRRVPDSLAADAAVVATSFETDAQRLECAFERGDFGTVVALYAGAFLEGVDTAVGVEVEEWIVDQRERFAALAREAHLRLGDDALGAGDLEAAQRHARVALDLRHAPPDVGAFARIHRLLARTGSPLAGRVVVTAQEYGAALARSEQGPRPHLGSDAARG